MILMKIFNLIKLIWMKMSTWNNMVHMSEINITQMTLNTWMELDHMKFIT